MPDASWRPLVTSLGYPVGFLIVVLGRQQLFTENTITVLPVAAEFTAANLRELARLWAIVCAANSTGTAAAAVFCTLPPVLTLSCPNAESSAVHVITWMTYLIGVGGFQHIVASSAEAFLLIANGQLGLGHMILSFLASVVLGNIDDGTALFTLISHAHVMNEIPVSADRNRPPP